MPETLKELRRALSKLGVCSRKEAEAIIQDGRVTVDGKIITDPRTPVLMTSDIRLDGKKIAEKVTEIYAFNKPKGVITTMDLREKRPKVVDFMPKHKYLFPIGRLDKNSRGLLLFTNDNQFADYITSPISKLPKTYRVQIKGKFIEKHKKEMERGIFIDKIRFRAENVKLIKINPKTAWLEIVLVEGKNRQIRRMLETLNYEILELVRTQIGRLELRRLNLKPGEFVKINKNDLIT